MIIGVDGTISMGDAFWGKMVLGTDNFYFADNSGSFVWKAVMQSKQAPKMYFRGPDLRGGSCKGQAGTVANLTREWVGKYPHSKVCLVGHSRGGAICIEAAYGLKASGIQVHCLVLFDAVERAPGIHAQIIPSNVRTAWHAIRDDKAGSRGSFGHCGLHAEQPCRLGIMKFLETHAAIGGFPWTGPFDHPSGLTESRDKEASRAVWAWMSHFMAREGI
jgi:hypothetical protein